MLCKSCKYTALYSLWTTNTPWVSAEYQMEAAFGIRSLRPMPWGFHCLLGRKRQVGGKADMSSEVFVETLRAMGIQTRGHAGAFSQVGRGCGGARKGRITRRLLGERNLENCSLIPIRKVFIYIFHKGNWRFQQNVLSSLRYWVKGKKMWRQIFGLLC